MVLASGDTLGGDPAGGDQREMDGAASHGREERETHKAGEGGQEMKKPKERQ